MVQIVHAKKPRLTSKQNMAQIDVGTVQHCPGAVTIDFPPNVPECDRLKYHIYNKVPSLPMSFFVRIKAMAYKFLCQAYLNLIPINQMNMCTGDNSREVMILMLANTSNIGTIEATGHLNWVVRNTATDISTVKLNCAEDRRIRWTSYQNLDLWFDIWEVFLVGYGFATVNTNVELVFDIEMMKRPGRDVDVS
jgi:hypothetical protein